MQVAGTNFTQEYRLQMTLLWTLQQKEKQMHFQEIRQCVTLTDLIVQPPPSATLLKYIHL